MLLPFQLDGLRFGLQRGGRCLSPDEMCHGKTLQAIAIAGCFIHIVCPAILWFSCAEELEQWLPSCLPFEIHLDKTFEEACDEAVTTKTTKNYKIIVEEIRRTGKGCCCY